MATRSLSMDARVAMSATPTDTTELTRQQLEELDALLQRMLALTQESRLPATPLMGANAPHSGLSQLEDKPDVPAGAIVTTASPGEKAATDPSPPPAAPIASVTAEPQHGAMPPLPQVESPQQPITSRNSSHVGSGPAVVAGRVRLGGEPAEASPDLPLAEEVTDDAVSKELSPIWTPLIAVNAIYDGLLAYAGWPGRILRAAGFKTLLGLAGIVLLIYTLLYLLQQHRVLSLPVVLPWTAEEWSAIISQLQQRWWPRQT